MWVRANAINGYVSELEVYAGKVTENGEKRLGQHVVEKLTNALKGRNHGTITLPQYLFYYHFNRMDCMGVVPSG